MLLGSTHELCRMTAASADAAAGVALVASQPAGSHASECVERLLLSYSLNTSPGTLQAKHVAAAQCSVFYLAEAAMIVLSSAIASTTATVVKVAAAATNINSSKLCTTRGCPGCVNVSDLSQRGLRRTQACNYRENIDLCNQLSCAVWLTVVIKSLYPNQSWLSRTVRVRRQLNLTGGTASLVHYRTRVWVGPMRQMTSGAPAAEL